MLRVERINHSTGEMEFLSYMHGTASETDTNITAFAFNDSVPYDVEDISNLGTKYTYKFTACSAPVAELISSISQEVQRRSGHESTRKLNFYGFSSLKMKLTKLDTHILSEISNKYTRGNKRKQIIDIDTQVQRSNGNSLSTASTGDTAYLTVDPTPRSRRTPKSNAPDGMFQFSKPTISYYPALRNTKIPFNKFNNSRMSHKFIIDMDGRFKHDIDHAAIFSFRNNKLSYECVIHASPELDSYRALIEMERVKGKTVFYLFPVTNLGRILKPVVLGNHVS